MSNTVDPVAVPLHGLTVAYARPSASRRVKGEFLHAAPHLADARTHAAVPASEDKFDHSPDFAPTVAPAPRF